MGKKTKKVNPLVRASLALAEINQILEKEGLKLIIEHNIKLVPRGGK